MYSHPHQACVVVISLWLGCAIAQTDGYPSTGEFVPHMVSEDGSFPEEGGHQRWGYVEVRPGAYQFWWLYYTTHPDGYRNRPWLIWLEGGPGDSATVLANLGAIGPEDVDGTTRSTSWVNSVSVMFIDSPVGVGFSYYEEHATMPNTTEDTTNDLIQLYKVFTDSYTDFKELPLYIFGHSYGGRASAALGYFLRQAQDRGELECNLNGIGLGNSWVSPSESTLAVPPLFLHMGFIGEEKYVELMKNAHDIAHRMRRCAATGRDDPNLISEYWGMMGSVPGLDTYNMLRFTPSPPDQSHFFNTVVKDQLRIIPEHVDISSSGCCNGLYRYDVFRESGIDWADEVLKMGDVKVTVYQGNLDIVCPTKGAIAWVDQFTWEGMDEFRNQPFTPIDIPGTSRTADLYVRAHDNLKFYTVIGSGHYVTSDVAEVATHMLNRVIDDLDRGTS